MPVPGFDQSRLPAYPIYFGGSEALHRYPSGSFTAIDIYQPDQAVSIVRNVIGSNLYAQSSKQIAEARGRVLGPNNIISMLADYWRSNLQRAPAVRTVLLPKSHRAALAIRQIERVVKQPFRNRAAA